MHFISLFLPHPYPILIYLFIYLQFRIEGVSGYQYNTPPPQKKNRHSIPIISNQIIAMQFLLPTQINLPTP